MVSTEKKIKCWGRGRYGALGYGNTQDRGDDPNEIGNNLTEVDLGDNFDVTQIITGDDFSCASSVDGKC